MHASSLENMQKCYERFLGRCELLARGKLRVVDIGGANVNGSYADIFSAECFEYVAVDLVAGPGVDIVLEDAYQLPFETGQVDMIVSGQAFEHVEFFWKLFEEMSRVLSRDGLVFLIVPSAGPVHRFPVDCYRFYPDSMAALARYAGMALVGCWMDNRGPWNDLVGVFAHSADVVRASPGAGKLPVNRYMEQTAVAPLFDKASRPEVEITAGKVPYLETLEQLHAGLTPRLYFEIGVRRGTSLALAACPAIAVDPKPELATDIAHHHRLYEKTSDAFFDEDAPTVFGEQKPDLVFIDGMHLFEFALRDFINVEQYSLPGTLVVVDDIYPNHPAQAERSRRTRVWAGDVWKLHHCLARYRPDLHLLALDTEPTGLLLVAGLDPGNRVLLQRYNPIVREHLDLPLSPGDQPLSRCQALDPDDLRLGALLAVLREHRDAPLPELRHSLAAAGA